MLCVVKAMTFLTMTVKLKHCPIFWKSTKKATFLMRFYHCVKWLPVNYKAWMTGHLFEEWMLIRQTILYAGRKVLLFIDNCLAHPKKVQRKLKFIELAFFPPNMTFILQPLDQSIIRNLKHFY